MHSGRTPSSMRSSGAAHPQTVEVQFQVHLNGDETPSHQDRNSVWLIGADPSMGQWIPANAIPMTRLLDGGGRGKNGWSWSEWKRRIHCDRIHKFRSITSSVPQSKLTSTAAFTKPTVPHGPWTWRFLAIYASNTGTSSARHRRFIPTKSSSPNGRPSSSPGPSSPPSCPR